MEILTSILHQFLDNQTLQKIENSKYTKKIHHCRIKLFFFPQNCKIFRSPKLKTHQKKKVYTDKLNTRNKKKKQKDFGKKQ